MEFLLMSIGHNFRKLLSNRKKTAQLESKTNKNTLKSSQNTTFLFSYLLQAA